MILTSLVNNRGHFWVTTAANNVQISTTSTCPNPTSSMRLPHLLSWRRDSFPGIKISSYLLDTASDHLPNIHDDLVRPIKALEIGRQQPQKEKKKMKSKQVVIMQNLQNGRHRAASRGHHRAIRFRIEDRVDRWHRRST
jgi:hypothetical protein